jgi:PAS domain S-box-containing protein
MSEVDVFADAPVAMALVAADGRLLRVNTARCDLLGYPAGELMGRALDSFSHPHHAGRTGAELGALRAGAARRVQTVSATRPATMC